MRRQGVFLVLLGVLLVASILTFAVVFQLLREDVGQIPAGQSLLSVREDADRGLTLTSLAFWSVLLSPILAGATLFFLLRRNRSWHSRSHLMGLLCFAALLVLVFGMVNPRFSFGSQEQTSTDLTALEKLSGLLERMQGPLSKLLKNVSGMPDAGSLADALKGLSDQTGLANAQLQSDGLDAVDTQGLAGAFKRLSDAVKDNPDALRDLDADALRDLLSALDGLGEQGLLDQMKEREELVQTLEQALQSQEAASPELAALLAGLGAAAALESGVQVSPEGLNAGTTLSPEGGHSAPDVPLFKVRGAKYTGYLRQTVADTYDGRTWMGGQSPFLTAYTGRPLALVPEGATFRADVEIEMEPLVPFISDNLITSLYPDGIDFPRQVFYNPAELTFHATGGITDGYRWRSIVLAFAPDVLRRAGVSRNPRYTQLPEAISQEIRDLAAEVTRGIANPYDKAAAIRDYLKSSYTYDFDYQNAPLGVEPTYWFLFREKRGTCANFANAFVIMARSVGIPSRPVAGFAISETAAEQVVTAAQAHQWAEVLFEGIGWVTFEPTPSAGPSGRVARPTDPLPEPTPIPTATVRPTPSPTPRTSPLTRTITDITELSSTALKGEPFMVYGAVMTEAGQPVEQMDVEIYLNTRKVRGGMLIGTGQAAHGTFAIEAVIPPDTPVGSYQVLAHAIADERYQESWSDPPLVVAAETTIEVEEPPPALIGEQTAIDAYLREAQSRTPIQGQTLVLVGPGGPVANARTDKTGRAEFSVTAAGPGVAVYAVRFEGTEFYSPAESNVAVRFQEPTGITCQFPKSISLGSTDTARCALTDSDGDPILDHSIVIGFGTIQMFSYPLEDIQPTSETPVVLRGVGDVFAILTDRNGEVGFDIAPTRAGGLPIFAYGTAMGLYASSASETIIAVSSSTSMKLDTLDRAIAGQPYPLQATVLDALGNPVSTGTVTFTAPSGTLGEATVDESGLFSMPHRFQGRGILTIEAAYSGSPYYQDTSTSASLAVASPTQIALTLPQRVGAREQVLIGGTLMDDAGVGLGGHGVRLEIGPAGGAQAIVLTTDVLGRFSLPYAFPEAGTYGIHVTFDGSGLLLASSASVTLEVLEAVLEPMVEPVLVRGNSNSITGRLLLGGSPVEGVLVNVLMDGDQVGSGRTDAGGGFGIEYTPPVTTPLGTHKLGYRVPRYELSLEIDAEIRMLTYLSISAGKQVHAGGSLKISAMLLDDLSNPRMGQLVLVEGMNAMGETDYWGIADIKVRFPRDAATGPTTLTVVYPGKDRLVGARAEHTVQVLPATVPWMLIAYVSGGSVGGLALAGAVGYVGYRRRDRLRRFGRRLSALLSGLLRRIARWLHLPAVRLPVVFRRDLQIRPLSWLSAMWAWMARLFHRAGEPVQRLHEAPTRAAGDAEDQGAPHETTPSRKISRRKRRARLEKPEFPQVQPPFPDVWGVGYPFEVSSRLLADDESAITEATLVCQVNGSVIQRADTNTEGRAAFRLRFETPKEYAIHIVFEGNEEFRSANAVRGLRVVDYRQEVVDLYHACLDMARQAGMAVPKDGTPRDTQAALREARLDQDALEDITRCFEEADYSTHEIARRHYEETYLAYLRLAQSFGKVGRA